MHISSDEKGHFLRIRIESVEQLAIGFSVSYFSYAHTKLETPVHVRTLKQFVDHVKYHGTIQMLKVNAESEC